jgi:hypothetical protein
MEHLLKHRKKINVSIVFFVLTMIILIIIESGCSKKQDPIKIGLATTLTGKAST